MIEVRNRGKMHLRAETGANQSQSYRPIDELGW
jgi:hypothetical protein